MDIGCGQFGPERRASCAASGCKSRAGVGRTARGEELPSCPVSSLNVGMFLRETNQYKDGKDYGVVEKCRVPDGRNGRQVHRRRPPPPPPRKKRFCRP